MAVSIKNSSNFFTKLGINPLLVSQMQATGIETQLGFFDLRFVKNGSSLAHVKLVRSTNEIMKGLPSFSEMDAIRKSVESGLKLALDNAPAGLSDAQKNALLDKVLAESKGKVSAGTPASAGQTAADFDKVISQMHAVAEGMKVTPTKVVKAAVADILSKPTVALKDAEMMYQPVRGTDPSSRYFVIAMNERVKVAARVANGKVSVRVEGALTAEELNGLLGSGLTNHEGKYLSAHFTYGNVNPNRVIGAVLLGCGVDFTTPLPDLSLIK